MLNIITNNHVRDIIDAWQLTESERADFDYLDWQAIESGNDSASFIRYRGTLYPLSDFMTTARSAWGGNDELSRMGWDGYLTDTYFSGVCIRYARTDDGENIDPEGAIIGRFYACECSEDDGPCASHMEQISYREGSSNRSADELCAVFIDDAMDALQSAGYTFARAEWEEIDAMRARLDNPESWEGSWLRDDAYLDDTGRVELREAMRDMADRDLTDKLGEIGLSVQWEDGYCIYRLTGGPLSR